MTLQVRNLAKHFGGVQAVSGVSFDVRPGECVALIGPNGAGKSTTFACIAGQQSPSSGQVIWSGESLNGLSAAQRLQRGIVRTFQVAQTFDALSVLQNMQLLLHFPQGLRACNVLERMDSSVAMQLLALLGLDALAQTQAAALPYGAKKRLELAMSLASISVRQSKPVSTSGRVAGSGQPYPQLLLLDEPAAGLAAPERASLMAVVKSLVHAASHDGPGPEKIPLAVLYTEHNMDAVFGVADRVLVLMDGALVAQGTPQEIAANATVRSRYLGQEQYGHA